MKLSNLFVVLKFIDFKYRNLPGGGRAKVQVWAQ